MHFIPFGILFLIILQTCSCTSRLLITSEIEHFTISLNRLRNNIAQGMVQGWKPAANMNALSWSSGLAARAESCVKQKPFSHVPCDKYSSPTEFGLVIWRRHGAPTHMVNSQKVLEDWLKNEKYQNQIVMARMKQFGCAYFGDASVPIEFVACYFDKPYDSKFTPYIEGTTGSACEKKGGSDIHGHHFAGLCPSAFHHSKQLIHTAHHQINHQLKGQSIHHKQHKKQHKMHHNRKTSHTNLIEAETLEADLVELSNIDFVI